MNNTWVKFRHKVVFGALRPFFSLVLKAQYGYRYKKFKLDKRPYLILSNHQTKADQFLISLAFNKPIYFVARDDLFSMGFASKLIKYLVAPIPKNKVAKDIQTIRDSMTVVREGGTIALCVEGNLTFSGTTEYIDVSTAKYVKLLKLPVIFFNLKGGYGARPRWAGKTRKGLMTGGVKRVMEYEEYENMSVDELLGVIRKELYVDDRALDRRYRSNNKAEFLENCIYVCPKCGITHFVSDGNVIKCEKCGYQAEYGEDLRFNGGEFESVKDWYEYQKAFIRQYDISNAGKKPIFSDKIKFVKGEIKHKRKRKVAKRTELLFYADRIEVNDDFSSRAMKLDDISAMAVLGRNKLEISHNKQRNYFIIPTERFNALKYVQMFYHYKNVKKGESGENEFLGL